jgi:hypothetical protein
VLDISWREGFQGIYLFQDWLLKATQLTAGGNVTVKTQFTLYYDGGKKRYDMEQELKPHQQTWVDVGRLIHEQVPDKNGSVLPSDLTMGAYELHDLTDRGVGNLFEGKVIVDKTFGHVAYGCATCCGYGDAPYMYYDPIGVALGFGNGQDVWDMDFCTLKEVSVLDYIVPSSWDTGDHAIATASSAIITGVSVGSTTNFAQGTLTVGGVQALRCPRTQVNPSGSTSVASVQIVFGGKNITGTTQSVVVGQQIALTGSFTPPPGVTVTGQSWSVAGTTVGGYSASSSSGATVGTNFSGTSTTFYWVYPSTVGNPLSVTITLKLSDGTQPVGRTSFNVTGPTNGTMTSTAYNQLTIDDWSANGNCISPAGIYLVYGSFSWSSTCAIQGTSGISFSGSVSGGSGGSILLVQLVNSGSLSGGRSCTLTPGLDTAYPYPYTNDSPSVVLLSTYTTLSRTENFTMYMMWQSNTANSIPVPIGYQQWGFQGSANCSSSCGSAANWKATTQRAGLSGGFVAATSTQPNYGYPTWSGKVGGC